MNYELAKKLKDAGFSQEERFRWSAWLFPGITKDDKGARAPSLSELIEACGDKFGKLVKEDSCWYAYDASRTMDNHSLSPEEAVAKLWLALNKNDNPL